MTLQIIIPCAGEGRRFREAGYLIPKPFMDVAGKSMIARVMESLTPSCDHRFQLLDRATVGKTEGAVDTLLRADIDPDEPVLVANCDQLLLFPIDLFLEFGELLGGAASLVTFTSFNPHHSYVVTDGLKVTDIREKEVISNHAVVGIYWFREGRLLTEYANKVIANSEKVRGEFYLSSALKLMLDDGVEMTHLGLKPEHVAMLGTPEELSVYLETL